MGTGATRRDILKGALLTGSAALLPSLVGRAARGQTSSGAAPAPLPWEREIPLREAARTTFITAELPLTPQAPMEGQGSGAQLLNPAIRAAIWGPSHRVTLSLLKNDVWDRRLTQARFPTAEEVVENAMAPGAAVYKGPARNQSRNNTRPELGMLMADGTISNPLSRNRRAWMKVTGQVVLMMDSLEGASQPQISHRCSDGVARMKISRGENISADLEYVVSMTDNVYAIRGDWRGLSAPVALRLYRNQNVWQNLDYLGNVRQPTAPLAYPDQDRTTDGFEPPVAGTDGRFFWVRQKLPPEKTFPEGFEYVLMGIIDDPAAKLEVAEGKVGLGTPSPSAVLKNASGSAATASFVPVEGRRTTGYVAVVSTVDANGGDIIAEARKRLESAMAEGFEGVVAQNEKWYTDLYNRREAGRTFYGATGHQASDDVPGIFYSWFCKHGGCTKTDMRKYQAAAHYCVPETEPQRWMGLPCYNEVFYTDKWVHNRGDSVDIWKQLAVHWIDAARKNAREVFALPGMFITHGFLPPVLPDIYVHSNIALEFCVDSMAQTLKPVWDEWDYQADEQFLRETCYPLMREMCLFYAAYAKKGDDGRYHIIPSMQQECWGFYPGLSRNKDCIAALSMFKWALRRTTEAAKLLGVDADLWPKWMEIAENLAPYPTWDHAQGKIFAGLPGVEPWRGSGDHPWDVGSYPTLLADEINLDSDEQTREMMVRTMAALPSSAANETVLLLGRVKGLGISQQPTTAPGTRRGVRDLALGGGPSPERLINSRSGRIHLFPCVPEGTVAFRRFQARGGFLVSASRDDSGVTYLEIEPRRSTECRVMNPWPGKRVSIRDGEATVSFAIDRSNGECIVFPAVAGHRYLFSIG